MNRRKSAWRSAEYGSCPSVVSGARSTIVVHPNVAGDSLAPGQEDFTANRRDRKYPGRLPGYFRSRQTPTTNVGFHTHRLRLRRLAPAHATSPPLAPVL